MKNGAQEIEVILREVEMLNWVIVIMGCIVAVCGTGIVIWSFVKTHRERGVKLKLEFIAKERDAVRNASMSICAATIDSVLEEGPDGATGDKDTTVIVIEDPPHRWRKDVMKLIKRFGRQIDGHRNHKIHALSIPPEMFKIMERDVPDWDEV